MLNGGAGSDELHGGGAKKDKQDLLYGGAGVDSFYLGRNAFVMDAEVQDKLYWNGSRLTGGVTAVVVRERVGVLDAGDVAGDADECGRSGWVRFHDRYAVHDVVPLRADRDRAAACAKRAESSRGRR